MNKQLLSKLTALRRHDLSPRWYSAGREVWQEEPHLLVARCETPSLADLVALLHNTHLPLMTYLIQLNKRLMDNDQA